VNWDYMRPITNNFACKYLRVHFIFGALRLASERA
jgi:hypothetical protein